jgi:hypothetical protein
MEGDAHRLKHNNCQLELSHWFLRARPKNKSGDVLRKMRNQLSLQAARNRKTSETVEAPAKPYQHVHDSPALTSATVTMLHHLCGYVMWLIRPEEETQDPYERREATERGAGC